MRTMIGSCGGVKIVTEAMTIVLIEVLRLGRETLVEQGPETESALVATRTGTSIAETEIVIGTGCGAGARTGVEMGTGGMTRITAAGVIGTETLKNEYGMTGITGAIGMMGVGTGDSWLLRGMCQQSLHCVEPCTSG